jgi:bromodomain-containing factor 1
VALKHRPIKVEQDTAEMDEKTINDQTPYTPEVPEMADHDMPSADVAELSTTEPVDVLSTQVTSQTVETDDVGVEQSPFAEKSGDSMIENEMLKKEQFKWFGIMIRNLKKKKDVGPFLIPVDPVALGIPTYFTVITKPMDISTVEKKLASLQYTSIQEALDDVSLIFQNCFTFNGVASPVSLMAKNLQQWYTKECEKLPKSIQEIEMRKKKKPSSLLHFPAARESNGDSRPKRDSRDETGKRKVGPKKVEMKFCNYVHREMTKKQYAHFVWPFLAPVDPIALGIPTYFDIIKEPMDLSTIRKKLDLQEYNTPEEFEFDVRLMIQNCFSFNAPGTDIYNVGKQLETLFNTKWAEKASFMNQHGESNKGRLEDDSDEDGDGI